MTVYDRSGQPLESYDLEKGRLVRRLRVKPDAAPPDDRIKFAYAPEDYEPIMVYVPNRDAPDRLGNLERKFARLEELIRTIPGLRAEP